MQTVARFEKVSYPRFEADFLDCFPHLTAADAKSAYDALPLPRRATSGSAGYDFFAPAAFTLAPGEGIKIPTGIRARIDEGWVLTLYPRSGQGFKYRLQLYNTVGVIDSDYFGAANEGHIHVKIVNANQEGKTLTVKKGEAFAQGIFLPFGVTVDDDASDVRTGGFGSTDRR